MASRADPDLIRQERDSYREKFEHMKILVNQLQQENGILKIRGDGFETVTSLLQECRQENAILQKQKSVLTTAVHNLQNRLASNQLPVNPGCQEGEVIIPGTSKELLDNLARENARLRNTLQNLPTGDLQEKEKLQEMVDCMQQKVNNLEKERDVLKQTVERLESEKSHQPLPNLDQVPGQENGNYSSSDQVSFFRQLLQNIILQGQELESHFQTFEKSSAKGIFVPVTSQIPKDTIDSNIILEEKRKLEEKLAEALSNNRRWQEYNNGREKYVHELSVKNEELEMRIKKLQSEEVNALLAAANLELRKAQDEKNEWRIKSEQERRARELELEQLRRRLPQTVDQATLDALRAQVQMCTEDFEMERKDREKAQSRVSELEQALDQMRKELQTCRLGQTPLAPRMLGGWSQYGHSEFRSPGPGSQQTRNERQHINDLSLPQHALESRGPQDKGDSQLSLPPEGLQKRASLTSTDHLSTQKGSSQMSMPVISSSLASWQTTQNSDRIRKEGFSCPSCHQVFPEDKNAEFVKHIDQCWDND